VKLLPRIGSNGRPKSGRGIGEKLFLAALSAEKWDSINHHSLQGTKKEESTRKKSSLRLPRRSFPFFPASETSLGVIYGRWKEEKARKEKALKQIFKQLSPTLQKMKQETFFPPPREGKVPIFWPFSSSSSSSSRKSASSLRNGGFVTPKARFPMHFSFPYRKVCSLSKEESQQATTLPAMPAQASPALNTSAESNNGKPQPRPQQQRPRPQRPGVPGQSDDDSGCALEEYAWEPPGLKPDQVRNDAENQSKSRCIFASLRESRALSQA